MVVGGGGGVKQTLFYHKTGKSILLPCGPYASGEWGKRVKQTRFHAKMETFILLEFGSSFASRRGGGEGVKWTPYAKDP